MANSRTTTDFTATVEIDTAPGVDGYFTSELNIRNIKTGQVFFSVGGSGTMTAILQFKRGADADWVDYASTADNGRAALKGGGANVKWRAGVKSGLHTSGTKVIGFDW